MIQITKVVQEIGNGGHIYLPKEIVGKKVLISLVEKGIGDIKEEVLGILKPHLNHISGVYLYGSYARGEQAPESDIDILVISDGKVKISKRINEYEIICSSLEEIEKTIENNAVIILPILKEAILNESLIERYKEEKLTKKNARWYIETTESSLKLARHLIDKRDVIPTIVYPLMLRLRGLYLMDALAHNKRYFNKDIMLYLVKKGVPLDTAKQLYTMYREYRDEKSISKNSLNYEDISKLYDIVHNYFQEIKALWAKLK